MYLNKYSILIFIICLSTCFSTGCDGNDAKVTEADGSIPAETVTTPDLPNPPTIPTLPTSPTQNSVDVNTTGLDPRAFNVPLVVRTGSGMNTFLCLMSDGKVKSGEVDWNDGDNWIYNLYDRNTFKGSYNIIDDNTLEIEEVFNGEKRKWKYKYYFDSFFGEVIFCIDAIHPNGKVTKDPALRFSGNIKSKL